jgi:hypothetical protein
MILQGQDMGAPSRLIIDLDVDTGLPRPVLLALVGRPD